MVTRRTISDNTRNEPGLVDEYIGTSYDVVKTVYDNLDDIKLVLETGGIRARDDFVGNGVKTEFTLSQDVARATDLEVYLDGELLPRSAYSFAEGKVTFGTIPANGAIITVFSLAWRTTQPLAQLIAAVDEKIIEADEAIAAANDAVENIEIAAEAFAGEAEQSANNAAASEDGATAAANTATQKANEAAASAATAQAAALSAEESAEEAAQVTQAAADALSMGTISILIEDRIYTSRALLEADLVPDDEDYALVVGDPTPANNDLYKKNGATGTGDWSEPLGVFAAASAQAQAYTEEAEQIKEDTQDLLDAATEGMEFIGATSNVVIAGETRPVIGALAARDSNDFLYALMAFVQSDDSADIISEPLRRYVSSLAISWPEYMQFIIHGQSLGEGAEGFHSDGTVATSLNSGFGSLRTNRGGRTWYGDNWPTKPENRAGMNSLVPLTAQITGALGEQPANGFCDSFKARINGRFGMKDISKIAPNLVFTSAIRGSTRLTAITSEDTGNTTLSTSTSLVTLAAGSRTFIVGTGLTLPNGNPLPVGLKVRMANAVDGGGLYDFAPYMNGTITSYNSGTGELIINVANNDFSSGGQATWDKWRLILDSWSAPGNYWNTMLADVQAVADIAAAEGKTHSVVAFLHMQGERNSDLKLHEYDQTTVLISAAIADYKTRFKAYAQEVQDEISDITGQRVVPFLTYQTLSNPAAQAQLDAALESPNLITMVGPTYACPRAWNGSRGVNLQQLWGDPIHLAADGERMFGEMASKVRWKMEQGESFKPLHPISATKIDANTFDVVFHVPCPPLVLDTNFLAKAKNYGFIVYPGDVDNNGTLVNISNAVITNYNTIRFTTVDPIPAGAKFSTSNIVTCDLGVNPIVTEVGTSDNTIHGFATKYIKIAGDQRALLAPLSNEGAFTAFKVGATETNAIIRNVSLVGGDTVLTYETRQSFNNFAVNDTIFFGRGQAYTNLRDSDPTASLYTFNDPGYPTRLNQPYPLWNWCVLFSALPIQGA